MSGGCLIVCEKLRAELVSKTNPPSPELLVSRISLFNGAASRIALWTQHRGTNFSAYLDILNLAHFSGLLDASGSNGLDPGVRFGLQKLTGRLFCTAI